MTPNEFDRESYVPNVVYSCGGMIHQDELIIPYVSADQRCGIATLSVRVDGEGLTASLTTCALELDKGRCLRCLFNVYSKTLFVLYIPASSPEVVDGKE